MCKLIYNFFISIENYSVVFGLRQKTIKKNFIPLRAKLLREVENLTGRKNPHTPVYGVKEFVRLSVVNFDLNYLGTGKTEWVDIFLDIFGKMNVLKKFCLSGKWQVGQGPRAKTATSGLAYLFTKLPLEAIKKELLSNFQPKFTLLQKF